MKMKSNHTFYIFVRKYALRYEGNYAGGYADVYFLVPQVNM
jgi:hypothetical protein